MVVLLVHSPLVGPSTWEPLASLLRRRGLTVALPDLRAALDAPPPIWAALVTRATENLVPGVLGPVRDGIRHERDREPDAGGGVAPPPGLGPIVVGHSGAGVLLPAVAARLDAASMVFVDALVPPTEGAFTPSVGFRAFVDGLPQHDGRLPPWTTWWGPDAMVDLVPDPALRGVIEADGPAVPRALYDEAVPVPDGWSDRPAAYLQLSPAYDAEAAEARRRGWPVERLTGGHLDLATRPSDVLAALDRLLPTAFPPAG